MAAPFVEYPVICLGVEIIGLVQEIFPDSCGLIKNLLQPVVSPRLAVQTEEKFFENQCPLLHIPC